MAMASQRRGPLSYLRVLDLTQFLSGPFATQILGDLGADVIKVEAPDGDMTRRLPPHFVGPDSAYFHSVNRNKRSVVIDMKSAEGQALVRRLALACDVVIENYRPGVLARLALSYEDIAAQKPDIIWCSLTGFGQNGPYRDRPAYDMIVQAMSGGMSITGEPDGSPVRSGIPIGDLGAGLYSVVGILAAEAARQRTGRGEFIDVAMLDCQIALLSYQGAYYLASGQVPQRQGAGHDSIPTYRSFSCGDDRDLVITANTERMWERLCAVLELPHLLSDPRFKNNKARYAHRLELWPMLEAAFRTRSAADWVAALVDAEIPAAVVNTIDVSMNDPQVLHRNMVLELEDESGERLRVPGNPIKLASTDTQRHYPPRLGSDLSDVLGSVLGMNAGEIAGLRERKVVGGAADRC